MKEQQDATILVFRSLSSAFASLIERSKEDFGLLNEAMETFYETQKIYSTELSVDFEDTVPALRDMIDVAERTVGKFKEVFNISADAMDASEEALASLRAALDELP